MSIPLLHPEGNLCFGMDIPSRREHHGLDNDEFNKLTYEVKKKYICVDVLGNEAAFEDYCDWIIFDYSKKILIIVLTLRNT